MLLDHGLRLSMESQGVSCLCSIGALKYYQTLFLVGIL